MNCKIKLQWAWYAPMTMATGKFVAARQLVLSLQILSDFYNWTIIHFVNDPYLLQNSHTANVGHMETSLQSTVNHCNQVYNYFTVFLHAIAAPSAVK